MYRLTLIYSASLLLALSACSGGGSSTSEVGQQPQPTLNLGDPITGLTAEERASFDRGREVFRKRFTPSQGLGPLYNATSCESCHSDPVLGGGADLYRNFYMSGFFGATPISP